MSRSGRRAAVLAVDGGNSKTEVVLLDGRGQVLGAARGPGSNHSHSDPDTAMRLIDSLVGSAAERPTASVADVAVLCLAGADYPQDERRLEAAAATYGWADRIVVCNDAFAMLRAGTDNDIGVALVCGAGVNCVGRGHRGRTVRFPALGDISGDWGGGNDVGMAALAAAVRAEDGRGPRTVLSNLVPRHFGFARPSSLVAAIYNERIDQRRVVELPPLVFAADDESDGEAAAIVDRLVTELIVMAVAALRRLQLTRADVDVVLGGGILTSGHARLLEGVSAGILRVAPRARLVRLGTPAVTGAALLGFDELGVDEPGFDDVRIAVREALKAEREAPRKEGS